MNFKIYSLIVLICAVLAGCGGGSGSSGGNKDNGENTPQKTSYVNWETVPSNFHPSTDDISFRTDGIEKINVDAFGFDEDVEVIYSQNIPANEGALRIFKVWNKQASWGDLRPRPNGKNLDLKNYGSYQCSISVQNGQIVALEGGCYVKLQIFLPVGAEIEVYNIGQLITKKYIPMKNETFLEAIHDATWADDKFVVIENYLASYTGSKKPSLTSYELGKVIHEFMKSEEKFKALRRLHAVVSDRQNLGTMIETEFNYFDREEARRIVGLN